MNEMTVGLLKKNFSKILKDIENGEEYTILFGRNSRPIAKIIPFSKNQKRDITKLGGTFKLTESENSKISTEEFLGL